MRTRTIGSLQASILNMMLIIENLDAENRSFEKIHPSLDNLYSEALESGENQKFRYFLDCIYKVMP